jgi:hypothetical protein
VPPGSLLVGPLQEEGRLGRLNEEQFTYEWRHPDARMDELHARVSRLVEEAEANGEDVWLTFYRLKSLAASFARAGPPPAAARTTARARVPKLSEPWFC